MTRELPDELTDLGEEEHEQRRQTLQQEAADARRELEAEQQELLESLGEEHGGDRIQTTCSLPGDNVATIDTVLNGELINRMTHVEEAIDLDPSEGGGIGNVERAMDEAAAILADITDEPKYSKEVFYQVYELYGPEALGEHVEAVFDAIGSEVNRQAGAVDGFRNES